MLSIQPKIPDISVGTSNGTDHFGLVRPEYSRPALRACVAWQFWLGALSNKGGRGQRNREEIGFYFFIFLAALQLVLVRFAREFRVFAARAPGSTKPPSYAG